MWGEAEKYINTFIISWIAQIFIGFTFYQKLCRECSVKSGSTLKTETRIQRIHKNILYRNQNIIFKNIFSNITLEPNGDSMTVC